MSISIFCISHYLDKFYNWHYSGWGNGHSFALNTKLVPVKVSFKKCSNNDGGILKIFYGHTSLVMNTEVYIGPSKQPKLLRNVKNKENHLRCVFFENELVQKNPWNLSREWELYVATKILANIIFSAFLLIWEKNTS